MVEPPNPLLVINPKSNEEDRVLFTFYNILVSIKLDEKNFTIWEHQILKIFRSLELDQYVL